MKKIILILLTVVMLFSIFVVSAFASDEVLFDGGTYEIDKGTLDFSMFTEPFSTTFFGQYENLNTGNIINFSRFDLRKSDGHWEVYLYDIDSDRYGCITMDYSSSNHFRIIVTRYDQMVPIELYNFINVNSSLPICDGTACPANDANLDGICDDCGKTMTMSLRSPTLEEMKASSPYYHYFIYKTVDSNTGEYIDTRLSFLSSNSPMTLVTSEWDRLNDSAWGNVSFRFTSNSDIDGVNYISHDGGTTWERSTTYSNGTTLFSVDENMIASTFDIYDTESGTIFFPLPLWEITQGVTTETLNNQTTPSVVGTMSILTLCGVGLMALLVVLSLYGKRSLISRR